MFLDISLIMYLIFRHMHLIAKTSLNFYHSMCVSSVPSPSSQGGYQRIHQGSDQPGMRRRNVPQGAPSRWGHWCWLTLIDSE